MKNKFLLGSALLALLLTPLAAEAQSLSSGVQSGAAEGARSGGPVGAVLGGVAGGVIGGVSGVGNAVFGASHWPTLQEYVREGNVPSQTIRGPVRVGARLPRGLTLYAVPPQFGVDSRYDFSVVNNEIVLVDSHSRRVVQVIPAA